MVIVQYESRYLAPRTDYYYHAHTARTILLLSGYLPSEDDESVYINMYTREIARLTIRK